MGCIKIVHQLKEDHKMIKLQRIPANWIKRKKLIKRHFINTRKNNLKFNFLATWKIIKLKNADDIPFMLMKK